MNLGVVITFISFPKLRYTFQKSKKEGLHPEPDFGQILSLFNHISPANFSISFTFVLEIENYE